MSTLAQLKAGKLTGLRRLSLACGLTEFPEEIFDLADSLEILDLSGNQLIALPDALPRLHKLRILFCSQNAFTELPAVLGRCKALTMVGFKANAIGHVPAESLSPALRWLVLTDNHIDALPPEIGRCTQLQKLMLAGNRLQALPPEMATCTGLELLRLSANRLAELPAFLRSLPRLSWLAFAGNPFCEAVEAAALRCSAATPIKWTSLRLQQPLGEGASGVIHQAQWLDEANEHAVAVKIFKGAITSDGFAQSEMTACLSAGAHPHLIPVLGQVFDHPGGANGLVMALIAPQFTSLAGPPSLDSCTRDCYAAGTTFSLASVLGLALGIAQAARHLHAQGLMHGDLYAHNILHDGTGVPLLGDFGAASFLPQADPTQALGLQRLEVRAFGCLLDELLERCSTRPDEKPTLQALYDMKVACLQNRPDVRPTFSALERQLLALAA